MLHNLELPLKIMWRRTQSSSQVGTEKSVSGEKLYLQPGRHNSSSSSECKLLNPNSDKNSSQQQQKVGGKVSKGDVCRGLTPPNVCSNHTQQCDVYMHYL